MRRFKKILFISEPSVDEGAALAEAVSLARTNQAELKVVGIVPVLTAGIGMPAGGPISNDLQQALVREHREDLESLVEPHRRALDFSIDVLVGPVFLEAIRLVLHETFDLIIKPAEDPDWSKRLFGSDDMHLLRKCPCPVWLIKTKNHQGHARVMAAVDFEVAKAQADAETALNNQIVEMASSLVIPELGSLHVVHAWDAPGETLLRQWVDDPKLDHQGYVDGLQAWHGQCLDQLQQRLKQRLGSQTYDYLNARFHLIRGGATTVIPRMAAELEIDLVVMGTVARTGISGFFIGNTAEAVLDQLRCSVLAVKPEGFKSPITLADD